MVEGNLAWFAWALERDCVQENCKISTVSDRKGRKMGKQPTYSDNYHKGKCDISHNVYDFLINLWTQKNQIIGFEGISLVLKRASSQLCFYSNPWFHLLLTFGPLKQARQNLFLISQREISVRSENYREIYSIFQEQYSLLWQKKVNTTINLIKEVHYFVRGWSIAPRVLNRKL